MRASIVETVKATYFDAPPPSDAFRFTLFKEIDGAWVATGYTSDCSTENPVCEMEIIEAGKYKVMCRRLNIYDYQMGPYAESDPVFVNGGEYDAPFRLALGFVQPDDAQSGDGVPV